MPDQVRGALMTQPVKTPAYAAGLDDEQLAAVMCDPNAVVTAGAGSGKTTVLTARYLRMVIEKRYSVGELLTLTFTRKAATEMYDRIYRKLAEFGDDPFVAEQIAGFDSARIGTLDSFCAEIARNGGGAYGVPPTFRYDEREIERLARRTAVAFVVEKRGDPTMRRLVSTLGFTRVTDELFGRLAREFVTVASRVDLLELYRSQVLILTDRHRDGVEQLHSVLDSIFALEPVVNAIKTAHETIIKVRDTLKREQPVDPSITLDAIRTLGALNARTGRSEAIEVVEYKEHLTAARSLSASLTGVCETIIELPYLENVFRLADEFAGRVVAERRNQSLVTYQDVLALAVRILTENRSLRRFYKKRFRHIMIDEFQDNNELQKQLLFLLAERTDREREGVPGPGELESGKLFFVGDEKQSIYLFRGADVSVFKALSIELTAAGGRSITLPTNYRSRPELVAFFNTLFTRVMAQAAEPFEAVFTELRPGRTRSVDPRVELWIKPYTDSPSPEALAPEDAEAYHVVRRIHDWITIDGLEVAAGDGTRRATYDDVAILLRSTSNQKLYERYFRLFGIPYSSQAVRTLFLEAPAYDIYAALQLAAYPEDRVAYVALLRSPFVNVGDEALLEILAVGSDEPPQPPFAPVELTGADAVKYEAGRLMYRKLLDMVDVQPVADVITMLWYQYGYRYTLLRDPRYHTYLEYYEYLVEFSRSLGRPTLVEFLAAVRAHLGEFKKIDNLEIIGAEARGVQIMTVHGSKGLEFPVVFLPNAGNTGRQTGAGTQTFHVTEHGIAFNVAVASDDGTTRVVNPLYAEAKELNDRRDAAELKRLLYVAATRAESHLVISGHFHARNRNSDNHFLGTVVNALGIAPDFVSDGRVHEHDGVTVRVLDDVSEATVRGLYRDTAGDGMDPRSLATVPVVSREAPRVEYTATELNAMYALDADHTGGEPLPALAVDALIAELGEARFGTVTHFALERALAGNPLDPYGVSEVVTLPPEYRFGDRVRDGRAILAAACATAERFLDSELGELARTAESRSTETPFLYRVRLPDAVQPHAIRVSGMIDLLIELTDRVIVVDYKTDKTLVAHAYDLQLSIYEAAAREITGKPVECLLYYLRGDQVAQPARIADISGAVASALAQRADPGKSPTAASQGS
ncbi:MAG: hypothetical protein EA426_11880 [Spirochaetaceae bacterium]|nr:MAG: hypothetical protein EA426_11880 [Spirochaetaceae bacterium]